VLSRRDDCCFNAGGKLHLFPQLFFGVQKNGYASRCKVGRLCLIGGVHNSLFIFDTQAALNNQKEEPPGEAGGSAYAGIALVY